MVSLSRRAFLGGLLATAACSKAGPEPARIRARPTTVPASGSGPFALGVASGDPDPTSVVLWTRLLDDARPLAGDVPVAWEVLDDRSQFVDGGETVAEEALGHAVHVVVDGLEPATSYRYRFRVGDSVSPEGVTRTAPQPDDPAPLALAVASCQRYDEGFYAAHNSIAIADVDLVVFLGDYVYESAQRVDAVRPYPNGPEEAVDLAGYRRRYEAARRDPALAAAHAAHPWVVIWDDHEVRDDYNGGEAAERRAAAYQAWWEHQPVRIPRPDGASLSVHRSIRWGALLELVLLDTRQHRSAPPCEGDLVPTSCPALGDGARTVLGPDQEQWLVGRLRDTDSAWTAVAQSVPLGNLEVQGLVNSDGWDAYPAAQVRVLDAIRGVPDPVVLTGDLHMQLVADVVDESGGAVATEFVAPSVSSWPGNKLAEGVPAPRLPELDPRIRFADADHRGWMRCDVDEDRWQTSFFNVSVPHDPHSQVLLDARFRVDRGRPGAEAI